MALDDLFGLNVSANSAGQQAFNQVSNDYNFVKEAPVIDPNAFRDQVIRKRFEGSKGAENIMQNIDDPRVQEAIQRSSDIKSGGMFGDALNQFRNQTSMYELEREIGAQFNQEKKEQLLSVRKAMQSIYDEASNDDTSGFLGQLANSVGYMKERMEDAAQAGLAGGAVGALGGLALGGPAGVVGGALTGAARGFAAGGFLSGGAQGAGMIYSNLRDQGIDHKTAQMVSMAGGAAYSAVEQISSFLPAEISPSLLGGLFKSLNRNFRKASLLTIGKEIVGKGIGEAIEEGGQRAVEDLAFAFASHLSNGLDEEGNPLAEITKSDIFKNAVMESIRSLPVTMTLGIAGVGAKTGLQTAVGKNPMQKAKAAQEAEAKAGIQEVDAEAMLNESIKEAREKNLDPDKAYDIYMGKVAEIQSAIDKQTADEQYAEQARISAQQKAQQEAAMEELRTGAPEAFRTNNKEAIEILEETFGDTGVKELREEWIAQESIDAKKELLELTSRLGFTENQLKERFGQLLAEKGYDKDTISEIRKQAFPKEKPSTLTLEEQIAQEEQDLANKIAEGREKAAQRRAEEDVKAAAKQTEEQNLAEQQLADKAGRQIEGEKKAIEQDMASAREQIEAKKKREAEIAPMKMDATNWEKAHDSVREIYGNRKAATKSLSDAIDLFNREFGRDLYNKNKTADRKKFADNVWGAEAVKGKREGTTIFAADVRKEMVAEGQRILDEQGTETKAKDLTDKELTKLINEDAKKQPTNNLEGVTEDQPIVEPTTEAQAPVEPAAEEAPTTDQTITNEATAEEVQPATEEVVFSEEEQSKLDESLEKWVASQSNRPKGAKSFVAEGMSTEKKQAFLEKMVAEGKLEKSSNNRFRLPKGEKLTGDVTLAGEWRGDTNAANDEIVDSEYLYQRKGKTDKIDRYGQPIIIADRVRVQDGKIIGKPEQVEISLNDYLDKNLARQKETGVFVVAEKKGAQTNPNEVRGENTQELADKYGITQEEAQSLTEDDIQAFDEARARNLTVKPAVSREERVRQAELQRDQTELAKLNKLAQTKELDDKQKARVKTLLNRIGAAPTQESRFQSSISDDAPVTQQKATQQIESLARGTTGTFTADRTSSPTIGTLKTGNLTVRYIYGKTSRRAAGEIKQDGKYDYTVWIDPDNGRMTTVHHEAGHVVADILFKPEREAIKLATGLDLTADPKSDAYKKADEAFAQMMETAEGRKELADKIRALPQAKQSVVVRAINKVIKWINAAFGTKIGAIKDAEGLLAKGLEDFSILGQSRDTTNIAGLETREMARESLSREIKNLGGEIKKSEDFDMDGEWIVNINGEQYSFSSQYNPEAARWWYKKGDGEWKMAGEFPSEFISKIFPQQESRFQEAKSDYKKAKEKLVKKMGQKWVDAQWENEKGSGLTFKQWVLNKVESVDDEKAPKTEFGRKLLDSAKVVINDVVTEGDADTRVTFINKVKDVGFKLRRAYYGLMTDFEKLGLINPEFKTLVEIEDAKATGGINATTDEFGRKYKLSDAMKKKLKERVTLRMNDSKGNAVNYTMSAGEALHVASLVMSADFTKDGQEGLSKPVRNLLKDKGISKTIGGRTDVRYIKTQADKDAFVQSLDPEIRKEAERLSKINEELFQRVNAVYRQMYGRDMKHREFYTHISRQYSGRGSDKQNQAVARMGLMALMNPDSGVTPSEIERLTGFGDESVKIVDMYAQMNNTLSQMAAFIHLAPFSNDLKLALENKDFQKLARHRLGNNDAMYETWHKSMMNSINSMGGTFENADMTTSAFSRQLKKPLGNAAKAFLSDPFTSLKQMASLANFGGFFGYDVYRQGLASSISKSEMQKFIDAGYGVIKYRNSEFASGGFANVIEGFGGARGTRAITGIRGPLDAFAEFQDKAMALTRRVDQFTVEQAVKMAKIKVDQTWTGPKNDSYYQAVGQMADQAVISTQVSKNDISRTNLQRNKGGLVSGFTFMRGARSISGSNIIGGLERYFNARHHLATVSKNNGNVAEAQQQVAEARDNLKRQIIFHGALQSALLEAVRVGKYGAILAIAKAFYGETDDDDDKKLSLIDTLSNMGSNIAGLVPTGDLLFNWAASYRKGPQEQRWVLDRISSEINPALAVFGDFGNIEINRRRISSYNKQILDGRKPNGDAISAKERARIQDRIEELEGKVEMELFEAIGQWIGIGPLRTAVQTVKGVQRWKPKDR